MEFSFTKIVDFINSIGINKIKIVRESIEVLETDYSTIKDYYREIRKSIIQYFKNHEEKVPRPKKWSHDILKQNLFEHLAKNVQRQFNYKKCKWIENISKKTISIEGVDINVNPEIFVEYNGLKYIIKLYFKNEPLNKRSAELLILMLKKAYGANFSDYVLRIYDVRQNKLFSSDKLKIDKDTELALIEELKLFKRYLEKEEE